MKLNNAMEVRDHLWKALRLDTRSITFHLIDVGDDITYCWIGIIDSPGDLYDSDAWYDICTAHYDEEKISVSSVESYLVGDAEVDGASWGDCELIEQLMEESPDAVDAFLRKYADLLVSLEDFTLDNPCYEPDDEPDDTDE